jgi:hypothetical protein
MTGMPVMSSYAPNMSDLWYPAAVRDPAPESIWGSRTGGGAKFVLHTTEGGLGAFSPGQGNYYGNPYWPNYTLAVRAGRWVIYQHIPANWGGAALENHAGGVETNRACTQVEIATRATDVTHLPGEALDTLAHLVAWEHQVRGLPLRSAVSWVAYPASYGPLAHQRLSGAGWNSYAGILGHQHVPENAHGDPGAFPIQALLSRAAAIVGGQSGDDDMVDAAQEDRIATKAAAKVLAALKADYQDAANTLPNGDHFHPMGSLGAGLARVQSNTGKALAAISATKGDVDFVGGVLGQVRSALDNLRSQFIAAMGALSSTALEDGRLARVYADYFAAQLGKFTGLAEGVDIIIDPAPWDVAEPADPTP